MEDKKYYDEAELMKELEAIKKAREQLEKLAELKDKVEDLRR